MHNIGKLGSNHTLVVKDIRKRMKMQKKNHILSVEAQNNKLKIMLLRQKDKAYRQIELKQNVIVPLLQSTRKGLKTRKVKRRIIELNKGKNLFSYSTILSGDILDNAFRYSTTSNYNLSERMKKLCKYTLVPDLNFTDLFVFSHKPFLKGSVGTLPVFGKLKEVSKKQLAITPDHHVSGPQVELRSRKYCK
jgi:hypothetical protein